MNRLLRQALFRVLAVCLSLAPLVPAEVALRAFDLGQPELREDPFLGFEPGPRLFTYNGSTDHWEIGEVWWRFFRRDSFPVTKSPAARRIFCLGGSTVQGRPFSVETSFTTWLELGLKAADPDRDYEVVNCGGVSYASYRLVPILEEVLEYEPDLVIVLTGHNEFLEDRTYGHLKSVPEIVRRSQQWAAKLRIYHVLSALRRRSLGPADITASPDRSVLNWHVDARLDYRGGLEDYHHDPEWRTSVMEHYRYNLQRMVHLARSAGVPLVWINPASNLRDCPPFKSENRPGLSDKERQAWQRLCDLADSSPDDQQAVDDYRRALKVDDQYAAVHYRLARRHERLGQMAEARAEYLAAKEWDVCPLRILRDMQDSLKQVASTTQTPLIDADELLGRRCRDGIPGDEWFLDHVHPTIAGHQVIADALIDQLAESGWVTAAAGDWEKERERSYAAHLASLGASYFDQGLKRLERLRSWTRGEASRGRTRTRINPLLR